MSFKGKKAAPFKSGGGRKTSHPNTAKGKPRVKTSGTRNGNASARRKG